MRIRLGLCLAASLMSVTSLPAAQPDQAQIQQRVAELRQAVAANRHELMKYQWLQTTQVSIKGKTRKDQQFMCQYGPDGTVNKTPVGPPPTPPDVPTRGIRGHVAKNKIADMQDYTERLKSLIGHYAPPQPEMLKTTIRAGNASATRQAGILTLAFSDYYKAGDKVTFEYDPASKKLLSYKVDTYLDDPKSDIVTLTNTFATLPNGPNFLQQTVLNAESKQITVTTTNSGYSLPTQ